MKLDSNWIIKISHCADGSVNAAQTTEISELNVPALSQPTVPTNFIILRAEDKKKIV